MKSRIFIGCCLFLLWGIGNAFSQIRWDSIGSPVNRYYSPQGIDVLYADSTYLYMAGEFHIVAGQHMQGIARWNGVKWDSMGAGIDRLIQYDSLANMNPNHTFAMATYHHKLYVGGGFSSVGYLNAPGIGIWNDTAWDTIPVQPFINFSYYGSTGSVLALAVINNKLYMGGAFDTVAGKRCIGIACWNDTNWSSLNFGEGFNFEQINAICEYQGSIYVAGQFSGYNGGVGEIMRYDSLGWHSVDTGIKGTMDWINTMAVYNGELYVGGYFYKSDGNVGNCIQKWNGTSWHDVSGGVNHQIWKLMVYNGKLYAMGVLTEAGGVLADGIAEWDGTKWCSFAGYIDNDGISDACIYNDSLCIGGSFAINTSITDLAEWVGGDYTDSCENTTGIIEVKNESATVKVYPNPNGGNFILALSNVNVVCRIKIYNMLGEEVYAKLLPQNQQTNPIDLSAQPNGLYLYRVLNDTGGLIGDGKVAIQH